MTSFARTERDQLCDLALALGPDAPTLCGGWTVKDLVVHLLVRERSLVGAPGIVVPALSGLTERVSEHVARADLPLLVDQLRRPRFTWAAVPPVDRLANAVEFFVHHEDLRRAQPGWEPRRLADADEGLLWRRLAVMGRGLVAGAAVPLVVEDARTGVRRTLRGPDGGAGAEDTVVARGMPSELLLYCFGRDQVSGLELGGSDDAVRRLESAPRGF